MSKLTDEVTETPEYKLGYEEGFNAARRIILSELETVVVKDTKLRRGSKEYGFALRLTGLLARKLKNAK